MSSPSQPTLLSAFPWAKAPLICNAPMAGISSAPLAAEVTNAGGLGFLPCLIDISPGSADLAALDQELHEVRRHLGDEFLESVKGVTPVGVGFLTPHKSITHFRDTALPIIQQHRPAAVWLFAQDVEAKSHSSIISVLRSMDSSYSPKIFVQVGNVAAAREAVVDGADVIVCQGIDAGGHQFRQGMGVVAIVPEVQQMLEREFPGKPVHIVAAGGIANGKGVAAMMALGAEAVVMGTRFAVSTESRYAAHHKNLIVSSKDGGISTLKSPFNDQVSKSTLWCSEYDGRSIIGPMQRDFLSGASLAECQVRFEKELASQTPPRAACTWASSAVGLIEAEQGSASIVEEVRLEALRTIQRLGALHT